MCSIDLERAEICRYAPLMRAAGNWWRWLSSLVIQDSFPHLLATALLYGGLSLHVEARYGTRRTVVLTIAAALAGNFLDTLIMVSHSTHHELYLFSLRASRPVWGEHPRMPCLQTS